MNPGCVAHTANECNVVLFGLRLLPGLCRTKSATTPSRGESWSPPPLPKKWVPVPIPIFSCWGEHVLTMRWKTVLREDALSVHGLTTRVALVQRKDVPDTSLLGEQGILPMHVRESQHKMRKHDRAHQRCFRDDGRTAPPSAKSPHRARPRCQCQGEGGEQRVPRCSTKPSPNSGPSLQAETRRLLSFMMPRRLRSSEGMERKMPQRTRTCNVVVTASEISTKPFGPLFPVCTQQQSTISHKNRRRRFRVSGSGLGFRVQGVGLRS